MKKSYIIAAIAVIILAGIWLYARKAGGAARNQNNKQTSASNMENGLKIEDLTIGSGEEAAIGDKVSVNYIGTLDDGTKFDSSYDRDTPIVFTLGVGQVIPGWDKGLMGMKVGGKRRLTIAPEMAYGAQAVGPIPANSTLHFDVELVAVEHPAK